MKFNRMCQMFISQYVYIITVMKANRWTAKNKLQTFQSFQVLKKQRDQIKKEINAFKKSTLIFVSKQINVLVKWAVAQIQEKKWYCAELQKSKAVQSTMKNQVINLKQMINKAMTEYSQDLLTKDEEIERLKAQLQMLKKDSPKIDRSQMRIQDQQQIQQAQKLNLLQIIQEVSQHATYQSATATNRQKQFSHVRLVQQLIQNDSPDRQLQSSSIESQTKQSQVIQKLSERVSQKDQNLFVQTEPQIRRYKTQYQDSKHVDQQEFSDKQNLTDFRSKHRKTKSFINHFRQNLQESLSEKQQLTQIRPVCFIKKSCNPLQQLTQNQVILPYSHFLKQPVKISNQKQFSTTPQKNQNSYEILNKRAPHMTNSVYIPINYETSKFKLVNKDDNRNRRLKTQPCQNYVKQESFTISKQKNKFSFSHQQAFSEKKCSSKERLISQKQEACNLSRSSKSKIKVTVRIPQDSRLKKGSKGMVHLGGKSHFRKFLLQIKQQLKKYQIQTGSSQDQLDYQGQFCNGKKWGIGRIYYRNGRIYQGQLKQGKRHGRGTLFLNGISIYEGQWQYDKINGQGYIKSMRHLSLQCPQNLKEASYCGNLLNNRLQGIGTIFLNPRQKIVTKFSFGIPTGELTYYNLKDINFDVWPSQ